jgi:hypothetical protein
MFSSSLPFLLYFQYFAKITLLSLVRAFIIMNLDLLFFSF